MKYFDLLLERKKIKDEYLNNTDYYLGVIKKRAKKLLGKDTKVYIFGSYVKRDFGPNSDIDVLIVSSNFDIKERGKIRIEILRGFHPYHPFEIHLITPEAYENWYKKFIKDDYREV